MTNELAYVMVGLFAVLAILLTVLSVFFFRRHYARKKWEDEGEMEEIESSPRDTPPTPQEDEEPVVGPTQLRKRSKRGIWQWFKDFDMLMIPLGVWRNPLSVLIMDVFITLLPVIVLFAVTSTQLGSWSIKARLILSGLVSLPAYGYVLTRLDKNEYFKYFRSANANKAIVLEDAFLKFILRGNQDAFMRVIPPGTSLAFLFERQVFEVDGVEHQVPFGDGIVFNLGSTQSVTLKGLLTLQLVTEKGGEISADLAVKKFIRLGKHTVQNYLNTVVAMFLNERLSQIDNIHDLLGQLEGLTDAFDAWITSKAASDERYDWRHFGLKKPRIKISDADAAGITQRAEDAMEAYRGLYEEQRRLYPNADDAFIRDEVKLVAGMAGLTTNITVSGSGNKPLIEIPNLVK